MDWIITKLVDVGTIALLLFLIVALFAPFESLGWWAGWSKRWPDPLSLPDLPPLRPQGNEPSCYLVFLSGVGITDADRLIPKEQHFLDLLSLRLPDAVLLHNVFPYSAVNNPLTGARPLRWFWRWVGQAMRRPETKGFFYIVALRNMLQVAVSADQRYGPLFNFGVARAILLRLLERGYRPGSTVPIVLIGLSGSGQVAVGSGAALHRLLDVPIWVISIGGVLTSDPSILEVEHVYHLAGSQDYTQYLGMRLYPGCWPLLRGSAWNRAMARGKRTIIPVGPMKHMRHGDYFSRSATMPDGRSNVEHTVAVIGDVVTAILTLGVPNLPMAAREVGIINREL